MIVCHHCDNPPCCNPAHLFLGTTQDNTRDMVAKGRNRVPLGAANGLSKLTEADVREIRRARFGGVPRAQLTALYGVNYSRIYRIEIGELWAHVG